MSFQYFCVVSCNNNATFVWFSLTCLENLGSFKKDPTTKIKVKILKQLKVLKDNEFIDNKLYCYLKPTDLLPPTFYGQPKILKPGVPIHPIVSV